MLYTSLLFSLDGFLTLAWKGPWQDILETLSWNNELFHVSSHVPCWSMQQTSKHTENSLIRQWKIIGRFHFFTSSMPTNFHSFKFNSLLIFLPYSRQTHHFKRFRARGWKLWFNGLPINNVGDVWWTLLSILFTLWILFTMARCLDNYVFGLFTSLHM